MIVGQEPLDSGALEVGESVKLSYVDQLRSGIDPNKTLWEVVSDGNDFIKVGDTEIPSRAYVASFGFKGSDQQKRAGVLSGGERNRLNLALTLKQGGNLLLLDEPTNDLDIETLESLEAALERFPGCSVVTSHDRWFLIALPRISWRGRARTKIPGTGIGLKATLHRTRLIARNALGLKPQVRTAFTANLRAIRELASRFTCCYVTGVYTALGGSTLI